MAGEDRVVAGPGKGAAAGEDVRNNSADPTRSSTNVNDGEPRTPVTQPADPVMSSAGEFKARALKLFGDGYRVLPIPRGRKGPILQDWPAQADTQTGAVVEELIATANGC